MSKGSEDSSREKRNKVESYSIDVPSTPEDGSLHLVERTTVTQRSSSPGEQVTEWKGSIPVTFLRWRICVGRRQGAIEALGEQTHTIRVRDASGSFEVISVDTTKSEGPHLIQVQQTPALQSK